MGCPRPRPTLCSRHPRRRWQDLAPCPYGRAAAEGGPGLGLAPVASARDLVVARTATDRIVLDDRRVDVNGGADCLRFADGKSLSVAALVQAMAAFGTPAGGERRLARADVQQYLTPLPAPGAQGAPAAAPGMSGRRGLGRRGRRLDPVRAPAGDCRRGSPVLRPDMAGTVRVTAPPAVQDRSRMDCPPCPAPTKPVARAR